MPAVMVVPAMPMVMMPPVPSVMVPAVPMMVAAMPMVAMPAMPPHLGGDAEAVRRRPGRGRRRRIHKGQRLRLLRRRGHDKQSRDREKSKQFFHAKILQRFQEDDDRSRHAD
jgi:hypothetical protein